MKNHHKNGIKSFLLIAGFGFVLILILKSRDEILYFAQNANWILFAVSAGIALVGNLTVCYIYLTLLGKYEVNTNFRSASRVFFYSQITKYIPGKIFGLWYQFSYFSYLRKSTAAAAIFFVNVDLAIAPILLVTGLSIGLLLVNHEPLLSFSLMMISLLGFVYCICSCRPFLIFSSYLRKINSIKDKVCACKPISSKIKTFLGGALFGLVYTTSYALMLYGTFDLALDDALTYLGCLGLAWVVGVLVIVSPNGLGVREATFIFLASSLEKDISLELLSAIAIFARLWLVVIDVSGAFIVKVLTLRE